MANPVELFYGSTRLFRFDPMPTNVTFTLSKNGNSPMDLPSFIRPWMFDFTSQARTLTIKATLIGSTYNSTYPGSGSIADQIEDLMYIFSCNWANAAISGGYPAASASTYLMLFVPYPIAMDSAHNAAMSSTMYTSAGNSDYELDANSVPASGAGAVGGLTRASADKIYYVYPQEMSYERDEASVNRVHVSLSFIEVQDTVKI